MLSYDCSLKGYFFLFEFYFRAVGPTTPLQNWGRFLWATRYICIISERISWRMNYKKINDCKVVNDHEKRATSYIFRSHFGPVVMCILDQFDPKFTDLIRKSLSIYEKVPRRQLTNKPTQKTKNNTSHAIAGTHFYLSNIATSIVG